MGFAIFLSNIATILSIILTLPWIYAPITGIEKLGDPNIDNIMTTFTSSSDFLPKVVIYLRLLKLFKEFSQLQIKQDKITKDSKNKVGMVYTKIATSRVVLLVNNFFNTKTCLLVIIFSITSLYETDLTAAKNLLDTFHKANIAYNIPEEYLINVAKSTNLQSNRLVKLEICSTSCGNNTEVPL